MCKGNDKHITPPFLLPTAEKGSQKLELRKRYLKPHVEAPREIFARSVPISIRLAVGIELAFCRVTRRADSQTILTVRLLHGHRNHVDMRRSRLPQKPSSNITRTMRDSTLLFLSCQPRPNCDHEMLGIDTWGM